MGLPDKRSEDSDADRVASSLRTVQDRVNEAGPAAAASYTLIGAVLGLGLIGYAIDRWRGTFPWCMVVGLFLGMVVGFYELIKSTRR